MNCLSESLQENTRELTMHSSHSRLECHLPGNWSLLHWSTSQVYQCNNMSVSQLAFYQIRAYSSILCSFQVLSGIQLYQASLSEDTVSVQIWNTVKQVCWLTIIPKDRYWWHIQYVPLQQASVYSAHFRPISICIRVNFFLPTAKVGTILFKFGMFAHQGLLVKHPKQSNFDTWSSFFLIIPRKCAFLKKLRGSLALCWAGLNYPALDKLRGFTRLHRLEWKFAKLRNSFAAKRLGLYQHHHHQHALNAIKIGVQNDQCVFTFYDDNCFEYFCLDFNSTQFWLQNVCYFTQLKEILASWVLRRRQLVLCGDNQESISCAEADGCLHFHSHQTLQTFEHILHFTFGCLYWHIAHFFEPIHILHVLCTHTHTHTFTWEEEVDDNPG